MSLVHFLRQYLEVNTQQLHIDKATENIINAELADNFFKRPNIQPYCSNLNSG